uniref:YebC/PmpR family DNA-binding transcriptional regulator n=1 Tax=Gemmiger formicilis TaxID=745368 RepID=UPI003FEDE9B7
MSGHSKWATTKHRKAAQDAKRSALFSKLSRNITVAAKEGGDPNPENNASLAAAIEKAKGYSLPKDKIKTAIDKAFGSGKDAANYETVQYEGYGPAGVAIFCEALTDNRNRTAANMRHYFDKFGGNLGQMGCVGFMFTQKGVIVVDLEDKDPDELMMDALDAGADDFDAGEDAAEVTTSPENFTAVCDALEKKGYKFISADVAQVPSTTTALTDPDQLVQMGKLLDALDDDDDVQNAWHTLENEEDLDR